MAPFLLYRDAFDYHLSDFFINARSTERLTMDDGYSLQPGPMRNFL